MSLKIACLFTHVVFTIPKVPEEALNLLEEGECSSSDQEKNNYCGQNFPFDYFMWQTKQTLAKRRKSSNLLQTWKQFQSLSSCVLVAFIHWEYRAYQVQEGFGPCRGGQCGELCLEKQVLNLALKLHKPPRYRNSRFPTWGGKTTASMKANGVWSSFRLKATKCMLLKQQLLIKSLGKSWTENGRGTRS